MGIIRPPHNAHPFFAIMFTAETHYMAIMKILRQKFGEPFPCGSIYRVTDFTDYYIKEFGVELKKQFVVFKTAVSLENFHQTKVWTNQLELDGQIINSAATQRWINLDPGYLEPSKLVLFSTKNYAHRVYVGDGIYAEVTMTYAQGDFQKLPWTYPDYYWETNRRYLATIRKAIVKTLTPMAQ